MPTNYRGESTEKKPIDFTQRQTIAIQLMSET
jgi:hypothetical protein